MPNEIGQKIRELRKQSKMTQLQLAEVIGVSLMSIRNYESGKYRPSLKKAKRISELFSIPFDDVLELYEE